MEKLDEAPKYKLWRKHLIKSNLNINKVEEVFSRRNAQGKILFSLLMLDATTPEGTKIPPICFLKGEVVTVLVCLIDVATGEKYLLLVKQRRIAEGDLTYEHPAGMVDDLKTPLQTAIQEVAEETGIAVTEDQVKPILTHRRLFPSTGTSDECMYFFYVELPMSEQEIHQLDRQKMGVVSEHENITTVVLPFIDAHKFMNNTNCILLNMAYLKAVNDLEMLKNLPV